MRLAYEATLPELLAMSAAGVVRLNLDVSHMAPPLLAAMPGYRSLAGRISALPELDKRLALGLERYLLTLVLANANWAGAHRAGENPRELLERGRAAYRVLRLEADTRCARGTLTRSALRNIPNSSGYRGMSLRLAMVCELLSRSAPQAVEGSALAQEIRSAQRLAKELLFAAGANRRRTPSRAEAARLRNRAFTLFRQAYAEAKRAVCYLCPSSGEADRVLPPLYAYRSKR